METLVSATQVSSWRDCKRKWAWRSIAKIEAPPTAAMTLGIEVDNEQLQPYLRDGKEFDFTRESGYFAATLLPYLPAPKSWGVEIQKRFVMPSPSWGEAKLEFGYLGYIDLWSPDSSVMPECDGGGVPLVCDFKTTSDFKWAKDDKALREDVQAQLYAMYALVETGAPAVDLVWLYMRTKGAKKAKRSHVRVYRDEVAAQFAAIDRSGVEIVEAKATVRDPLELPPNPDACSKFGGCPYRDKCNLSPSEILMHSSALARIGGEVTSPIDLLSKLRTKAALPINPPEKDLPPVEAAATEPAPVVTEPPRRGRPAGSKNKPKETTAPTEPPPVDAFKAAGLDVTPSVLPAPTAPAPVDAYGLPGTSSVFKEIWKEHNREFAKAVVDELVSRLKGAS